MTTTKQQAASILSIFERRHADGRFYYSDKDVRHFLPMMALSSNVDFSKLPALQTVMQELYAKLGLPSTASADTVGKSVKAYYLKNPVNPELLAAYKAFCRSQAWA